MENVDKERDTPGKGHCCGVTGLLSLSWGPLRKPFGTHLRILLRRGLGAGAEYLPPPISHWLRVILKVLTLLHLQVVPV